MGVIEDIKGKNNYLKEGDEIIKVDKRYFRPTEVENLLGDSTLAKKELGWEPKISLDEMISEMMKNDLKLAESELLLNKNS